MEGRPPRSRRSSHNMKEYLLSARRGGPIFIREVVDVAKHLTDKQKKRIIADYATLGSYAATARKHKVSDKTVKAVVEADPETSRKYEQKKEENTADILQYMEGQKDDVCNIIRLYLSALQDPKKLDRASVQSIATSLGIIIDKFAPTSKNDQAVKKLDEVLDKIGGVI